MVLWYHGMHFWRYHCMENKYSMLWKVMLWGFHWGCYGSPMFFHFASFQRLLSKASHVNYLDKVVLWGPFASRMRPFGPCQGYFMTTQWHVEGWSLRLLQMGVCIWKNICCESHISWAMSWGCVRMLLFVSLRQSRGVLVVGLKFILCIVLGLFKKGLVFDDGCFYNI